jgi:signal transduction histidine kinase
MDVRRICEKLRAIEWLVLCLTAFGQWMFIAETHTSDKLYELSFVLLLVCASFASYIPWRLAPSRKLAYLVAQALFVAGAMASGAYRMYGLLFFVLAGKSSLILGKKGTIFLVASLATLHTIASLVAAEAYKTMFHLRPLSTGHPGLLVVEQQLFFCSAVSIVALFGRSFLAEQQLRRDAQRLSIECESMTIAVEHSRIARDIHDTLGHSLTSLNIQLELTAKLLRDNEIDPATRSVDACREIASGSLREVRRAVQSINTEDFSLSEAVLAIADRIKEQQKIGVAVSIDDVALSTSSRHNLLLIVKECLTNVQKHAQASKVEICLTTNNGKAELVVRDDGRGFTPDSNAVASVYQGCANVSHHWVEPESNPGTGTAVLIEVPT